MKPWWQRIQSRLRVVPSQSEDSILFRVLTQALVSVGILATDLAAETQMSLWAIPLSAIGASWSWYRRRHPNTGFKFLIAIALLGVLFAFFAQMFSGRLNDTRLLLAEFLIQVQVLHSFDLPRRKDLGYSMIIGLVLLGVASTLSQTMGFGILLLVFLAIALPVLMLDYCSRLGVDLAQVERTRLKKINFRVLPPIFFGIVLFGLLLFAVMPRLPGYQLRTFPVSAPIATQGQFDSQAIENPGYGQGGMPRHAVSEGKGQGEQSNGENTLDDESYYGFGNQMNQNLRGQLKPRVVMRVRSQAEGFWRVMAFDRYTGQGWDVSQTAKPTTLQRSDWSYRFNLPQPVTLNKTKEVIQTFTIVSPLPNLIPTLSEPKEVYFPTQEIAIDTERGLRSPVRLQEGMTYSVVSEVPYRDLTRLRRGSTFLEPPKNSRHLQLPSSVAEKIEKETRRILATSENELTSTYDKALFLGQYLKQNYQLKSELSLLEKDEDLAEAFLLRHKGGYRDHFSTTLTVMLRSIGVPARLVVGYAPGQFNPFTGLYIIRNTDAYAMTEMVIPKFGWFTIDPIPGHQLVPSSIEEDQTFSVLRQFWKWVAGWLPSPVMGWLGSLATLIGKAIGWFIGLFSRGLVGIFTAAIVLTISGFLGWLSWRGWRKWMSHRTLRKLPPMEQLYQQMLNGLAKQGFRKHPTQTPLEYAHQAKDLHSPEQAKTIQEISENYVQWRYGGQTPNVSELQQRLQAIQKRPVKNE
jgi:transglutaminase-like putative cysteine protease